MKNKPSKLTIRPATTAGRSDYNPELYKKEWKNGHKCFNAAESKAFSEQLYTESTSVDRFELNRRAMVRPRNPLNGDYSPRNARGVIVMNPNASHTVVGGVRLFSDDKTATQIAVKKDLIGKIGVPDSKYNILGNQLNHSINDQPDVFNHTQQLAATLKQKTDEHDIIRNNIAREKALRQQRDIERQINVLQMEAAEKSSQLDFLKTTYKL